MATIQVQDKTPRIQYVATAGQTVFPYPFIIFATSDLKVYKNGNILTETTDYTGGTLNDNDGGDVTLVSGAALNDIITIERDVPIQRLTDYQQGSNFDPDNWNTELRKMIAAMQQLERDIARKIGFAVTSTASNFEMPDPEDGLYLFWNGTALDNTAGPVTASDLTAIGVSDAFKMVRVNDAGDNLEYMAEGTDGYAMISNGAGVAPTWQEIVLGGTWATFDPAYDKLVGGLVNASAYYTTGYYIDAANLSDETTVLAIRDSSTSNRARFIGLREDSNGLFSEGDTVGATNATLGIGVCKIDDDKFLAAYADTVSANVDVVVGTIPAGRPTPSLGTPVSAYTTEDCLDAALDQLGTDAAILAFVEDTDPNKVFACAITISGTTPIAGTPVEMSADSSYNLDVAALSSTRAMLAYADADASNAPTVALAGISGTTVTDLGELAVEAAADLGSIAEIAIGKVDSVTAVVVYYDDTSSTIKYGIVDATSDILAITTTGTLINTAIGGGAARWSLSSLGSGVFCLTFNGAGNLPHRAIFTATTSVATLNKVEPAGGPVTDTNIAAAYNSTQDEITMFHIGTNSADTGVSVIKMRKQLT